MIHSPQTTEPGDALNLRNRQLRQDVRSDTTPDFRYGSTDRYMFVADRIKICFQSDLLPDTIEQQTRDGTLGRHTDKWADKRKALTSVAIRLSRRTLIA